VSLTVAPAAALGAPGDLDTSFGSGGRFTLAVGPRHANINAAVAQPDGTLVVAGFAEQSGAMPYNRDFLVERVNPNGTLDVTFNPGGATPGVQEIVFTASGIDRAHVLVLRGDGRIVVAGTANLSSADDLALAQLNDDGTLDTAGFGAGTGMVRAGPAKDQGLALTLAPGGKPVVAGNSSPTAGILEFLLARFKADGAPDMSFSGDGIETTPFVAADGTRFSSASSVAVQPDGKLLAGGSAFTCNGAGCADFAAARYNPDGSLDTTFGDAGKRTYGVGNANDFATAGVLDGGLTLLGFSFDGTREQLAAIRIAEDGGAVSPPQATPGIDTYRIELKAWIPHQVVVDPVRPGEIPFVVGFLGNDCFDLGVLSTDFRTSVESLLNGNGHFLYDGTFKGLAIAEFAWDGKEITNFTQSGQFGHTIRFLEYTVENPVRRTARLVRCVANTGQSAREATAEKVGPNTVVSRISTAIPVIPLAPPIDDRLTSVVSGTPPESMLSLAYTSDLFPSHAYRVIKNGVVQSTDIISDACCLSATDVRGLTGAALLGWGLSHEENRGSTSVGARDVGRLNSRPSLLCNTVYLLSRAVEEGFKARGLLARASRAPSLSVAPVDARGRPGRFMPLAQADARGLVDQRREGDTVAILADPAVPVALRLRGRRPSLVVRRVERGKAGAAKVYRGRRDLLVTQGASVRATSRGKAVRARNADRTPPKTTATVKRRGRQAILRFRVSDRSPIAALDVLLNGKRVKVRRGQARVPAPQLARIRFRSVDLFGNAERLKAPARGR